MGTAPYPPELYSLVHRGNPGDVAFYLAACTGAKSVLELGCGYGRVTRALVDAGLEVVGLDLEARYVAWAEAHAGVPASSLLVGDMADFDLGRTFDRIFIPYNGLYCLLSEQAVRRCLACARRHLSAGGLLIFDGYAADTFHAEAHPDDVDDERLEPVATVAHGGRTYDVYEKSRWYPGEQRIDATYLHVPRDGGRPVEATIPQRYLLSAQVPDLVREAGLTLVMVHGGFDQHVFDPDSPQLIVTATA